MPRTDPAPAGNAPLAKKDFEALSDFRYQLRRFVRWSEQLTRRAGVTNLQYLLLLHIRGYAGREWATIAELAERLQAHHHGVVALVSRVERLGYARRRSGRADRRQVEVHLTPKGARLAERLARMHRDELRRLQGILAVPGASPPRAVRPESGPGAGAPRRSGRRR